jgi:hypothetical protein
MNKELEKLIFLKGYRMGLINSSGIQDVNLYLYKIDNEISILENKNKMDGTTTVENSNKQSIEDTNTYTNTDDIDNNTDDNNSHNLYLLLQHINDKMNKYINQKNKNSNKILQLSKNKFNYRYIQYIQNETIKINNELETLKKIYNVIYNKYMILMSTPLSKSPENNNILNLNSNLNSNPNPNSNSKNMRNFLYNPTALTDISTSLTTSLNELNNENNGTTNNKQSEDNVLFQQFSESINNLTALIMNNQS